MDETPLEPCKQVGAGLVRVRRTLGFVLGSIDVGVRRRVDDDLGVGICCDSDPTRPSSHTYTQAYSSLIHVHTSHRRFFTIKTHVTEKEVPSRVGEDTEPSLEPAVWEAGGARLPLQKKDMGKGGLRKCEPKGF